MYLTVAGALNPQPSRYLGNIAPSLDGGLSGDGLKVQARSKRKVELENRGFPGPPRIWSISIEMEGELKLGIENEFGISRIWEVCDSIRSKKNGHWNKIQRLQPTALQKGQTGETEKKCQASAEVAANSSIQPHARSRQNMRTEDMVCTTAAWILATVFRMTLAPQ